ncbi:MAG TPA: T9SS type A sorting domain-containing protein, partial [Bacteroidetes bacterium]|nr:T9SS type A sorting domain-containing protein [Bacteroidota bacterium]HEX04762.1 T9SS type A sorting domain-containing protein [Bacteroidota bacterium]
QGNLLWEREFGGEGVDIVRRMRALPTGGFVLIGETELLPSTPESHDDMYVAMFTEDGDSVWTSLIGTAGDEECYGLEITSDGGLITAGSTLGPNTNSWDLYVAKVDTLGNTEYTWSYLSPGIEFGKGIVEQAPGEYVLTGKTTYQTDVAGSLLLIKLVETVNSYDQPNLRTHRQEQVTSGYTLHPVFPNPTNADAVVSLTLPKSGYINTAVYDLMGRQVAVLQDGVLTTGIHHIALAGNNLASGVYFVRAVVPGEMDEVQRITIIR